MKIDFTGQVIAITGGAGAGRDVETDRVYPLHTEDDRQCRGVVDKNSNFRDQSIWKLALCASGNRGT